MTQFINMKITFEDWKEGKITIDGTYYCVPKGMNSPKIVFWKDIDLEVQHQIRSAQKEIFENLTNEELKCILQEFNYRYQQSTYKEIFIDGEIKKIKEVLFTNSEANSVNVLYRWGSISPYSFENDFLIKRIRKYFTLSYIEGFNYGFDFINSLNSPFYLYNNEYDLVPEVQSEVLHRFYNYLNEKYILKSKSFDSTKWNAKAYSLFHFLSDNYIKESVISKYNLIYHFLKKLNEHEYTSYMFSMSKNEYYHFVKDNINNGFHSYRKGHPTMNPPDKSEKEIAYLKLIEIKKLFEREIYLIE